MRGGFLPDAVLTTSNVGMRDIWRNLEAHVVLHLFLTIGMSSNGRELILDYFRMTKHAHNSLSFVSQYVIVVVNTIVSNLYTVATFLDMVPTKDSAANRGKIKKFRLFYRHVIGMEVLKFLIKHENSPNTMASIPNQIKANELVEICDRKLDRGASKRSGKTAWVPTTPLQAFLCLYPTMLLERGRECSLRLKGKRYFLFEIMKTGSYAILQKQLGKSWCLLNDLYSLDRAYENFLKEKPTYIYGQTLEIRQFEKSTTVSRSPSKKRPPQTTKTLRTMKKAKVLTELKSPPPSEALVHQVDYNYFIKARNQVECIDLTGEDFEQKPAEDIKKDIISISESLKKAKQSLLDLIDLMERDVSKKGRKDLPNLPVFETLPSVPVQEQNESNTVWGTKLPHEEMQTQGVPDIPLGERHDHSKHCDPVKDPNLEEEAGDDLQNTTGDLEQQDSAQTTDAEEEVFTNQEEL